MAATKLSRTPSLTGGPGSGGANMGRTRGILIETMQLVEPRKEVPVPNHLLESKIYSKVAQNSVVQASPAVIHFGGFEPGTTLRQVLELGNVSTEVQRMHIIPPQTKYFYIKYTKGDRLVPGLTLDCTVEFMPDEWRYYYDCIRIHTKGEENLVVPIHAYPVMNTSDFPEHVRFPPVPLGQSRSKVLPLRCQAPIDFEFQLTFLQPHPAFRVNPMAGLVPANGEVDIEVTFTPTEFNTACMKLQLVISQFNAKPLVCNFSGNSVPGLAKGLSEQKTLASLELNTLDPRAVSPLDRSRRKKMGKKALTSQSGTLLEATPKEIEYAGIKFPVNLDTPYAVAQVLNQEPGKLRTKDLRQVVLSKKASGGAPTRQMKEAMFEMAVRQDVYEERQNQLRWQKKLGDTQISSTARTEVMEARGDAWKEYQLKRGDPVEPQEYARRCTDCAFRRTVRGATQVAEDRAKFDVYKNDPWAMRYGALNRFQQAARKVIVQTRANIKLKGLRQMIIDWGEKKFSSNISAEVQQKMDDEEDALDNLGDLNMQLDKIKSVTFATYVAPNVKDDMAVDALGAVSYKPTEVIIQKKVNYFNLKVPQQYKLMGYQAHVVHEAAHSYVPPNLAKPLRTGADDEIILLPAPAIASSSHQGALVNEGDLRLEDVVTPAPPCEALPLKPPQALFRPMEYPPLHIFNPAPGLQVFQPPLPYAETDPDFHLCPLPRYTTPEASTPHMATQKKYLDREDTVRGMMSWKRFPSQGLTSLSNTPTLSTVWAPRWADAFGSELLPHEVPPLYDGLPDEDQENISHEPVTEAGELQEEAVQLTPDMVNAEFALVAPRTPPTEEVKTKKEDSFPFGTKLPPTNIPVSGTGPVPREKREQELEYFLKKKYNRLGNKIQSRVDHLDNLKTNPELQLK